MNVCYIIKKSDYKGKFEFKEYKSAVPDVIIKEYTFPDKFLWKIRYKKFKKKLQKNEIALYEEYYSEKKILDKVIIKALNYVFDIYGWNVSDIEIALVIHKTDDKTISLISNICDFSRFLVIYGQNNNYDDLFKNKGICVRHSKLSIPVEKVVIKLDKEVELSVLGKVYNDVELLCSSETLIENTAVFDFICREFATENDIIRLFKNNYVKKMVLKSK